MLNFRQRGELVPMSGFEPLRAKFVASSPKSIGPWALIGRAGEVRTHALRIMSPQHCLLCYRTIDVVAAERI
jgi:hypothetical protein